MMPRTQSPLLRRICVTSACGAVLLLEGGLGGWLIRKEHPGATFDLVGMAAFSCVPVVLGMLFVRGVFKARSVRMLFDVLAILIWAFMVAAIGEVFTRGAPAYSGEGVLLTPIFSIGSTFGAVLFASAVGVFLWLRARVTMTEKPRMPPNTAHLDSTYRRVVIQPTRSTLRADADGSDKRSV